MTQAFDHFKQKGLTVFSQEDAGNFVNNIETVVKTIKEDKVERVKKMAQLMKKVDAEDLEYFKEDLEKTDKGIHHAMELSGFLLRNMGEQISPHIAKTLLPHFASVLLDITNKEDYELIDSVCFICDCMEHGGKALFDQIQAQAGPKFVDLITREQGKSDKNYDIVQSAIFGLGLLA